MPHFKVKVRNRKTGKIKRYTIQAPSERDAIKAAHDRENNG